MEKSFMIKTILMIAIFISSMTVAAYSQKNCEPKTVVFPPNSQTVTITGATNRCAEYLVKVKENQRWQIKLNSANPDVYFAMDWANQTETEDACEAFCEDCRKLDQYFNFTNIWKLWIYGGESIENRAVNYTLTMTLTDSMIIEGGVLNGKALSLPKPPFPPEAGETGAGGTVIVKIEIGEDGEVYFAEADHDDDALRFAAEEAALKAKFPPVFVNGKRVRVKGVIVYNFKAN